MELCTDQGCHPKINPSQEGPLETNIKKAKREFSRGLIKSNVNQNISKYDQKNIFTNTHG